MRIRVRRPRYQRSVRILLAFALLLPAGGVLQVARPNPASLFLTSALVLASGWSLYDAFRWVVVITRHGVGVVGVIFASTTWIAWSEITRVEVDGIVVSLHTRGRAIHQIQVDARAARVLGRMVERQLLGRATGGRRSPL